MASNFPIFHGIKLANGSSIENLHLEQLANDPIPVTAGRMWFNTTEKKIKYSTLDATGGLITLSQIVPTDLADKLADAKLYTDQKISDLVGGAPGLLDTLKELADALDADPVFGDTIRNLITTNIETAKNELKGQVTGAFDTLGELEAAVVTINGTGTGSITKAVADSAAALNGSINGVGDLVTGLTSTVNANKDLLDAEVARALAAELVLTNNLNSEIQNRTDAITGVTGLIDDEETRATGRENAIEAALIGPNGEVARALAAEGVLTTGLAQEVTTRTNEIARVEGLVTAEATRAGGAEGVLTTGLTQEVTTRGTEIARVEGLVTAEVTNRSTAVSGAMTAIGQEVTARTNEIARVDGLISDEVTTRGVEIARVEGLVTTEKTERLAEVAALRNTVNNVISNIDPAAIDSLTEIVAAYTAMDSSLGNTLTTLANTASADLQTETNNRVAADNALQTNIDNEAATRLANDNTLQTKITAEETARIGADATNLQAAKDYADAGITTAVGGTVAKANTLATPRNINGVAFDGSEDISFGTDSVAEGAVNKYFTVARARDAITVTGAATYVDGVINVTGGVTSVKGDAPTSVAQVGAVVLSKADIGLSNVDNTADAAKPVSSAQAAAIDAAKADAATDSQTKADAAQAAAIAAAAIDAQSKADAVRTSYNARLYTMQSTVGALVHTVNHNLNSSYVTFTVLVERNVEDGGGWRNDIVSVEEVDSNTLKIYLTASQRVKVSVQAMTAL